MAELAPHILACCCLWPTYSIKCHQQKLNKSVYILQRHLENTRCHNAQCKHSGCHAWSVHRIVRCSEVTYWIKRMCTDYINIVALHWEQCLQAAFIIFGVNVYMVQLTLIWFNNSSLNTNYSIKRDCNSMLFKQAKSKQNALLRSQLCNLPV